MRVFHIVWCLDDEAGGLPRAVVLIANAQSRRGLDVTVLSTTGCEDRDPTCLQDLDDEVQVRLFPRSWPTRRFAGSRGLQRYLRASISSDDVVHVHSLWDLPSAGGARAARRRGARLIVSPHGSLEPHDLRKHAAAKKLLGPLAVRQTLDYGSVLCTTPHEAGSLVTYGAHPRLATIPLPPGPQPGTLGNGRIFREAHGIGQDERVLLFLGRLDPKKGLGHLLRALPHLRVPALLVVAGTGEAAYERRLRDLATELGIFDRIIWAGWVSGSTKADAYAAADVFVLLSDAENYGITVIEALQHGCVVVASDRVGAAAWLAGRGALLITSRTARDAAGQLDRALSDDRLRVELRRAAGDVLTAELDPEPIETAYGELAIPTGAC